LSLSQRTDETGRGRKKKWCHFAFDTQDAPRALLGFSAVAGLPKERAAGEKGRVYTLNARAVLRVPPPGPGKERRDLKTGALIVELRYCPQDKRAG
jgi:hypothetical protein